MKLFNDLPVYDDTPEEMTEKHNITKLVEYERFCRDMQKFDEEKECFSEHSRVRISWFDGDGREFVERSRGGSRELWSAPKHKIYNTFVWLNGDKAVAEAQCMMGAYNTVEEIVYHRIGWARLLYRVQKEDGLWKIKALDCIYERDMLVPVVPCAPLDPAEFEKYRPSYRCISWLFEKWGTPYNDRLPGDDRPEILNELYEEVTNWLMQDKLLPPRRPGSQEEMKARMERVKYLEEHDAERYIGAEPVDVKTVYDAFLTEYDAAKEQYLEKRIILTGVVSRIGPDIWDVPSLELSDSSDGRCYGLIVFFTDEIYEKVKVGDTVTVLGNLLSVREPYGPVVKKCELMEVR